MSKSMTKTKTTKKAKTQPKTKAKKSGAKRPSKAGDEATVPRRDAEESEEELVVTDEEEAAGFALRTLKYPESYELPRLEDEEGRRLERAVAIVIDEANRIKRRHAGEGYVHEVFDGDGWIVAEEFENLDDVLGSDLYGRWKVEADVEDEEPYEPEEDEDDGFDG
jgi:hypothetical protein